MPAFSYAQAARGLAPNSAPAPPESKEANGSVADSKVETKIPSSEPVTRNSSPSAQVNGTLETSKKEVENKTRDHSQENVLTDSSASTAVDIQATESENHATELRAAAIGTSQDSAKSPSAPLSTSGKGADESVTAISVTESVGNSQTLSTSGGGRSETSDENKTKDGDEDWEKVSTVSIPAEKELKAAPIPTVNPWQKRAEEQDARRKAIAVPKPEIPSAATSRGTTPALNGTTSRYNPRPEGLGISEVDTKDRRRHSEASKAGQETRKLPRPVRTSDRELGNNRTLPSVHDATLWPTPENAITEEKKTPVTERHEKPEDGENKSPASKPHGKEKWLKVDVKWEHYNPTANARRGGRPNRGGRENGTRGGGQMVNGGNSADRSEKSGVHGTPATPRNQRLEDRTRSEATNDSMKPTATSVLTSRSPSAAPKPADEAKPIDATKSKDAPVDANENKKEASLSNQDISPSNAVDTDSARIRSNSKSTSRYNQTGSGYKGSNFDPARASGFHPDAHAHPRAQGTERRSMPPDMYNQADIFGSERTESRGRGYGRDKKETIKDGSMSWRERDGLTDRSERREPRSERGRGGYRGRGNHNNYGSHNTQNPSWSTPLPQNPFPPAKAHTFNERHRQSSAPFTGPMQTNGRTNPRSQSIPGGGYSNMAGYSQQPMSPTQQDFQPMYYQPMAYGYDFNLVGTMRMVQAQIEYYFSIENLCKDLFLRKHMDSKGYVLFTFVASFKRLRQLTDDQNIIRETCAQLSTIEYVRGDDGVERLRRRDNPTQWPLPMEERDPSAQNAGPANVTPAINFYERYAPMYGYPMPTGQDQQYSPWLTGQSPNMFSSPVYGSGRNDFDPNTTNVSSMNNSGILDSKDASASNDKYQPSALVEPQANGTHAVASAHSGYPLSNGNNNDTNGEQTVNHENTTQSEEPAPSGQIQPSTPVAATS